MPSHRQRRKSFGGKEEVSVEEQREKKGGQKAGYVIKIEREWERERTAAAVRQRGRKRRRGKEKFKEAEKIEISVRKKENEGNVVFISKLKEIFSCC